MNYPGLDDTELLKLILADDEKAFSEIYRRYWKLLYYVSGNILQNQFAAEEIVQDVFVTFWEGRKKTEIQNLKGYLQQIARFKVFKAMKSQKIDEEFYKRIKDVTADIIYENPLLIKEQQAFVDQLLNNLPEDCRQIFKLSREEHLTYRQIAFELSISEKTVEKKMSICLKAIRSSLEKNWGLSLSILLACYFNGRF
jgi:RNA polymerase sigma-70 factor (family 1)